MVRALKAWDTPFCEACDAHGHDVTSQDCGVHTRTSGCRHVPVRRLQLCCRASLCASFSTTQSQLVPLDSWLAACSRQAKVQANTAYPRGTQPWRPICLYLYSRSAVQGLHRPRGGPQAYLQAQLSNMANPMAVQLVGVAYICACNSWELNLVRGGSCPE